MPRPRFGTAGPTARRLYPARCAGGSCPASRPIHRIGDVGIIHAQFGQFGAHRIGLVDAYRRQHDASVFLGHVEIFRARIMRHQRLGQGQLVLGGQFCQHGGLLVRK
uniref:Uncharacterized protein n=1 Tax=Magnetospirillum gryphiswaldense TaxID=55518 RepID=Q3BK86_9PROT|nr:hypothetical protein mgI528 [Magnetospirillum gryphiswaldense MSR-1]